MASIAIGVAAIATVGPGGAGDAGGSVVRGGAGIATSTAITAATASVATSIGTAADGHTTVATVTELMESAAA